MTITLIEPTVATVKKPRTTSLRTKRITRVTGAVARVLRNIEYKNCRNKHITRSIRAWYNAKQPLIDLLSRHPDWDENAMAVVMRDKRIISNSTESSLFPAMLAISDMLQGCLCKDYRLIDLFTEQLHRQFNYDRQSGRSEVSDTAAKSLNQRWRDCTIVPQEYSDKFKITAGIRWCRLIRKIFEVFGKSKELAGISEHLNIISQAGIKELKAINVLSLHPCDYLLMSYGNSWSSCHSISSGTYAGGTLSYMLDRPSLVYYSLPITDAESRPTYLIPKISRYMCFYNPIGVFMSSGRLYPNSRDVIARKYCEDNICQIIAASHGVDNDWKTPRETRFDRGVRSKYHITCPNSAHFSDYITCSPAVSVIKFLKDVYHGSMARLPYDDKLVIGSQYVCFCCGASMRTWSTGRLMCSTCYNTLTSH